MSEQGVLVWVETDKVEVPDHLLRSLDPEAVDVGDILPSIERDGILQPLLGRPSMNGDGRIELVSGYRRLLCATMLNIEKVPFYVRELDDVETSVAELVENIARLDLPPHREAEAVLKILAYELKTSEENAASLIYRYLNYSKGLTENAPSEEESKAIRSVFERIGRKVSYFASDILPAIKWPRKILAAIEEGKISKQAAKALKRIESPEILEEAISRVAKGEPAKEVVKDVLGGASDSKVATGLQKQADQIEGFPQDEDGYIVPPPVSVVPEATFFEAIERDFLVREIIALLGWEKKRVALLHPDAPDVQRALEAGCRLLWVDSSQPAEHAHRLGDVTLPDRVIAFARIKENRAAKWGDPNENDPTGLDVPVEEAVKFYNDFTVVVARLEYAHLFNRRIEFVAVNENMTVLAVMM